mmetsp:Transcript_6437/g.20635  ORF Transcript_6437/g.20635 Transcript_6437/m.20635 type:complete len:309 (+) Transcript_6437:1007-1933(+)
MSRRGATDAPASPSSGSAPFPLDHAEDALVGDAEEEMVAPVREGGDPFGGLVSGLGLQLQRPVVKLHVEAIRVRRHRPVPLDGRGEAEVVRGLGRRVALLFENLQLRRLSVDGHIALRPRVSAVGVACLQLELAREQRGRVVVRGARGPLDIVALRVVSRRAVGPRAAAVGCVVAPLFYGGDPVVARLSRCAAQRDAAVREVDVEAPAVVARTDGRNGPQVEGGRGAPRRVRRILEVDELRAVLSRAQGEEAPVPEGALMRPFFEPRGPRLRRPGLRRPGLWQRHEFDLPRRVVGPARADLVRRRSCG